MTSSISIKKKKKKKNNNNNNNIFIQDNCISFRKKLLSVQVLLLKTKKDKETENNAIYKSKKINANAYTHHDSRLAKIIKNPCPFIRE